MKRTALAAWLVLSAGCRDKSGTDSGAVAVAGPELTHEQPTGPVLEGDSVELVVGASDSDGVAGVVVYHRTSGTDFWDNTDLAEGDGVWTATLDAVAPPGVEYYFKGSDQLSPATLSFLPTGASSAPYSLAVAPTAAALPFSEDFEPDDDAASLYAMDWWSPSDAFSGYAWALDSSGRDSEGSAVHYRGVSSVGVLADWLISPALDLSSVDAAMVTWWEQGAGAETIDHRLYISTSSRDPDDGTFEPVDEALAAPASGEWGRSAAVDLSAWAGEPLVYLAWFYQGEAADDWAIDDISVRALAPDLSATATWSPDPVHPGEATVLTVELENLTSAAGAGLVAALSLPDGGAAISDAEVDVGAIAGFGTASAAFDLVIDSTLEDNRYLPLALQVTDGVETWDFDLQLTVGQPSTATLALTLDAAGFVSIEVGAGDPDAATASVVVNSSSLEAGAHSFEADLTDLYALLPPAAGANRWFARIDAGVAGQVDSFAIEVGGVTQSATVLPTIEAEVPADVWLPEPPAPALVSVTPSSVSPGDAGVELSISLINEGDSTAGAVHVDVTAASDGVTVVSGASQELTSDPWEAEQTVTLGDVVIDVAADHLDSRPVQLLLALSDGVESWTVTVEVAVPWPVMEIIGIAIDDSGGDGVLDAGETATLGFEVANTGDADSSGVVRGVLSFAGSSTASATLTENSGYFGRLTAGSSDDDDGFVLQMDTGADGDTLDLVLLLDDGVYSYTALAQLVLGEPPWLQLSSTDDPALDTVDGVSFDIKNARYRLVDDQLELWLIGYDTVDADALFLEFWATGSGSSYLFYRWVVQAGVAKLQGYSSGSGFRTIATPELEYPDDTSVLLRWATADLAMSGTTLQMGLAAGWCGPDEYFCDHFPDGWGYPYVGYSSASWYSLSW